MESKGRLVILAIAGVIVAFGAISVYNKVVGTKAVPLVEKEAAKNRALVARRDLKPGMFVQVPQDVDWSEVPPATIGEEHIREGSVQLSSFRGAVVRRQLRTGDLVPQTALMTSGEGGFMSAVLEPGMRAVSVAVNPTSGNAGFISPGDRVDMIVTRKMRNNSGGGSDEQVVSETFLQNVRVLAVDQMLDNPENKAILAKTVTIEVRPDQAERVAVASELGKISLTLRSAGMQELPASPVALGDEALSDVFNSQAGGSGSVDMHGEKAMAPRIRIIRGDVVENIEMR